MAQNNFMILKFGLISYDVEKINDNLFEIHDTSSGWISTLVDKPTLDGLQDGTIDFITLNWR